MNFQSLLELGEARVEAMASRGCQERSVGLLCTFDLFFSSS